MTAVVGLSSAVPACCHCEGMMVGPEKEEAPVAMAPRRLGWCGGLGGDDDHEEGF